MAVDTAANQDYTKYISQITAASNNTSKYSEMDNMLDFDKLYLQHSFLPQGAPAYPQMFQVSFCLTLACHLCLAAQHNVKHIQIIIFTYTIQNFAITFTTKLMANTRVS